MGAVTPPTLAEAALLRSPDSRSPPPLLAASSINSRNVLKFSGVGLAGSLKILPASVSRYVRISGERLARCVIRSVGIPGTLVHTLQMTSESTLPGLGCAGSTSGDLPPGSVG